MQRDAEALHVYAVVRRGRRPDGLHGVDEVPVELIAVDDLEAVVSRHGGGAPKPSEDALVRHDAVCSGLMAAGAVAPIRFGAAFSDGEGVRAAIGARRDDLDAVLTRVEGHVEMGVRVLRSRPSEEPPAPTGSDYLRARLDHRRAGLEAAAAVDERLGELATDRRTRTLETPELVLSAAYLVPHGGVEPFRSAVEAVDRARADLTLVCTGPWPPYSFVNGDD